MNTLLSKTDAIQQGLKYYFTGKPCKHGHISKRFVSNGHCCDCIKIRHLHWRKEKPEKTNAASKRWRQRNVEKVREYKVKHTRENRERYNAYAVGYRARNKDKIRVLSRNYKARKSEAVGSHGLSDIMDKMKAQKVLCNGCGEKLNMEGSDKYHVDHVIPLSRGGSNWPDNIQLLCPSCNLSKGAKTHEEWMQKLAT